MAAEDLYTITTCKRCERTYLREASFCPHCGNVPAESLGEKLSRWFGIGRSSAREQAASNSAFSVLIGLALAAVAFYQAWKTGSIGALISAFVILAFAIRAWYAKRGSEPAKRGESSEVPAKEDSAKVTSGTPVFHCEECGAEVANDANECPKCGLKFGSS